MWVSPNGLLLALFSRNIRFSYFQRIDPGVNLRHDDTFFTSHKLERPNTRDLLSEKPGHLAVMYHDKRRLGLIFA
jgi:hypothetical protein